MLTHDITVYLPLFNLLFGFVNTVTASVTFAEGYLLCSLVNFAVKMHYVWQGVVIAILRRLCDIKNAAKMRYVCQDTKLEAFVLHAHELTTDVSYASRYRDQ